MQVKSNKHCRLALWYHCKFKEGNAFLPWPAVSYSSMKSPIIVRYFII